MPPEPLDAHVPDEKIGGGFRPHAAIQDVGFAVASLRQRIAALSATCYNKCIFCHLQNGWHRKVIIRPLYSRYHGPSLSCWVSSDVSDSKARERRETNKKWCPYTHHEQYMVYDLRD